MAARVAGQEAHSRAGDVSLLDVIRDHMETAWSGFPSTSGIQPPLSIA